MSVTFAEVDRSKARRIAGGLALALVLLVSGCAETDGGGADGERRQQAAKEGRSKATGDGSGGRAGESGQSGGAGTEKSGDESASSRPPVAALLGKLRVSAEVEAGYDRDLFYHWQVIDGCDVRDRVLARQDRRNGPCGWESGRWFSAYDGVSTSDPGDFDVDHMVPLAEAWASGARRWPEARRDQFANDLRPYSLIAVSASSNRSKSDQDPAEWMPESQTFACPYIARWIAVKFRWRLSIDGDEKSFLRKAVSGCRPRTLGLEARIARVP